MYILFCSTLIAVVVAVAGFAFTRARKRNQLSEHHRQHLAFAFLCTGMGVLLPLFILIPALFRGDPSLSAPESVYEYARESGRFSEAQLKVISAGVRRAHDEYWGSSGREPVFLCYPFAFAALGVVHFFLALTPVKKSNPTPDPVLLKKPGSA